jgi:hypothetical protein
VFLCDIKTVSSDGTKEERILFIKEAPFLQSYLRLSTECANGYSHSIVSIDLYLRITYEYISSDRLCGLVV